MKEHLFFLIFCLLLYPLVGQSPFVQKIDTHQMYIGDQQWLHQQSPNVDFALDPLSGLDSISWMELLEVKPWVKINENLFQRDIKFTVFDSGKYIIAPFPVLYKQDTQYTTAISLEVLFVPDSTETLRPIKDIITTPSDHYYLMYTILLILLLGVMLFILYKLFKADEKIPSTLNFKSIETADQIALRELQKLQQEKWWQQGQIKKHYDLLTEILRSYLAEGFFIPARESSTSEIIALMNHQEFKLVLQDEFARLLNISDLVKFANHSLSPESHLEFLKVAENFITANAGMIPRLVEQNKISYQKIFDQKISSQFENSEEAVPNTLLQVLDSTEMKDLILIRQLMHTQKFTLPEAWIRWHQSKLGLLNQWHTNFIIHNKQWYHILFIWIPALLLVSIFFPVLLLVSWFNKSQLISGGIFSLSKKQKILVDYRKTL